MSIAPDLAPVGETASAREAQRTLIATGLNHALHDGYTDLIYVLLPVWQGEFGLGFAALALLRSLYNGTLAALQVPSSQLARRLGARTVLIFGTLLSAGGYAFAGTSGGLVGLCTALVLGGAGGSTQHPLASSVIARSFGPCARGPLGTYNFTGDLGKASVPPLVGFLLTLTDWRTALWLIAGLGAAVALAVGQLLPRDPTSGGGSRDGRPRAAQPRSEAQNGQTGFRLLVAIGMLDNAARPAFLLYLPFLLQAKGAGLTTIGLALSLVFVGGALGKAVCGRLGDRLGVTRTVILTETGTAAAILAAIALPLVPALTVLPLLGLLLNGTSSVLYGTVPDLAPGGRVETAFAVFYTCTLGGSALAAPLIYGRLGDAVGPGWAAVAAAATALAVVPLMLSLSPHLPAKAPSRP
ncbi:MFS transporter [Methylobacterium soli]|uniref:MFS transporter n=1 Tax=Methylobacterium soli TaxID=553447 RepID=A0A6L3T0F5_9HYPH|nr:MFS transporter [Methylobacterium soli]KAB1079939.1 MFS transporter [Methylobacterium soli]GJE43193.1 putative sulfoacetate transporter SauU [Methylobacterium soli]